VPATIQLEDEGLIRATEREGSKVFEITEATEDTDG
jgi:DNA-binding PadR family transcriptional regulator